ncbi:MAG: glycosyltransferase [Burkholderiales bacterium]|nr:glycosyltransferase [Burkholderiales bacterium]
MDYDLWLRLLAHTRRFVRVPEVLAFYRWHGVGQISAAKGRQVVDAWQAKREFVAAHPDLVGHLGRRRIRELVNGSLHAAAFQAHWHGDSASAQQLFRTLLRARDVRPREGKHAIASLLPAAFFRKLQREVGGDVAPRGSPAVPAERAMPTPVVSVVMPCYNGARFLQTSLGSVIGQTFADFELVFVDDGSTDGSAEVAASMADERIRIIRQANSGVSAARNRGLASARGAYIAFLDADDTWDPAFLARMVAALATRPDAALAYCGWQNVGLAGGRGAPFVPPDYETAEKCADLIEACPWPIHAALTRRAAIEAAGGFDERFAVGEDFLLWMEIACFNPIVRVPEVLAYYHHHEGAQATKNRLRAALEPYRAQRKFLAHHPEVHARLGGGRVRELTLGRLLKKGYASYWAGDLEAARVVFRTVMRSAYGRPRDWKYMLPALLPRSMHAALLARLRDPQSAHGRH